MPLEILIVDDERDIRELVSGVLEDEGYLCRTAGGSDEALAAIDERRPSLVLLDVWLKGSKLDGLELLDEIKARDADLPVIIFSGHGNIDTAVSAISRGAMDFIEKPFEAERLIHMVSRGTETARLRRENAQLREKLGISDELTGNSSAINTVRATLKRVANSGSRLLITGPAGVGKEVAARLLHSWSARSSGPFITVNSARMTPDRFEQELFGEEDQGKLATPGLLERAHGGTLFLDEVADIPMEIQVKLLRVLENRQVQRLGASEGRRVNFRIVAATHRDLRALIDSGRFRLDLYYRLSGVVLQVPALRQRVEDIPALMQRFAESFCERNGLALPRIAPGVISYLAQQSWPGNVRQLRQRVEEALVFCDGQLLSVENFARHQDLLARPAQPPMAPPAPAAMPLRSLEHAAILDAIARHGGNKKRAAQELGISRSYLYKVLAGG